MARKNNINISKEDISKEAKNPKENRGPVSMDKIGSNEFYQGKETIEDIELPGEKKVIKTETVKKEEIYKDKMKQHEAFIASLGRKKETSEKVSNKEPEYVEEKSSFGKKIIFSVLGICVLGAIIGGGYWVWSKKKQKVASGEIPSQVVISINQEPSQDNSEGESPVPDNNQVEEIKLSEIAIKVLNAGAPAGSAGRVKDFLIVQGYAKTEAGNGQEAAIAKSYIFYKEERFKEKAQGLGGLLLKEKKISTEVKPASSAEEKSADIVVELGKT
jgi:hypothetical protein